MGRVLIEEAGLDELPLGFVDGDALVEAVFAEGEGGGYLVDFEFFDPCAFCLLPEYLASFGCLLRPGAALRGP